MSNAFSVKVVKQPWHGLGQLAFRRMTDFS